MQKIKKDTHTHTHTQTTISRKSYNLENRFLKEVKGVRESFRKKKEGDLGGGGKGEETQPEV